MSNKHRCGWCVGDTLYETYHDTEWGVPVYDDAKLFEFLILETFQAGLSWITILRKRENFRSALDNFNYKKIAKYNEGKIEDLLQDSGIIRNKLKIKATIVIKKMIRISLLITIYTTIKHFKLLKNFLIYIHNTL